MSSGLREKIGLQLSVEHRHGFVLHPDDTAVAGLDAVFGSVTSAGIRLAREPRSHPIAILRVNETEEQVGVTKHLLRRIADQPIDLRADEGQSPIVVDRA